MDEVETGKPVKNKKNVPLPSEAVWSEGFTQMAGILGRPVADREKERLHQLVEQLFQWNQRFNLMGPGALARIIPDHVVDSAWLAQRVREASTLADLGSGNGFPGLVLAILAPERQRVLLMESIGKKVQFLQAMIEALELSGIARVWHGRIEDARSPPMRHAMVVSRALGDLTHGARLARPLLKHGGCYITLKGHHCDEELASFEQYRRGHPVYTFPERTPYPRGQIVTLRAV
jgi:16S rRNA (guanine527-N7)-methyltransferase